LFWQSHIELINFKVNWFLYPILIANVVLAIFLRRKITLILAALMFFLSFYLVLVIVKNGELEGLIRFAISVLPFCFLPVFNDESVGRKVTWFWVLYCISMLGPLYCSYLQYIGKMPFYEFDMVNGQYTGRISGGYNKPMNLIAFIFPLYMSGYYLFLIRKKRIIGGLIILSSCLFLLVIGHRTSLVAFLLILGASFFKQQTIQIIKFYYRYFLNFVFGIISMLGFYFLLSNYGIVDGIRGRIPMWEAHAQEFFDSDPSTLVFGKQRIQLSDKYKKEKLVGSLQETHNNTFRTIVFFGIFGFMIYCLFVRWIVLSNIALTQNLDLAFIQFSCFIYLIFYTVTNEPFYYTSILWPVLVWILPVHHTPKAIERYE
jgi:hypothetical protein